MNKRDEKEREELLKLLGDFQKELEKRSREGIGALYQIKEIWSAESGHKEYLTLIAYEIQALKALVRSNSSITKSWVIQKIDRAFGSPNYLIEAEFYLRGRAIAKGNARDLLNSMTGKDKNGLPIVEDYGGIGKKGL